MYLVIKVVLWVFLEYFGWNVFIQSTTQENKNHLYLGCPDILLKLLCSAKIWSFFSSCLIPYQPCHILFCPVSRQILCSRVLNPPFSFCACCSKNIALVLENASLQLSEHQLKAGESTADTTPMPRTGVGCFFFFFLSQSSFVMNLMVLAIVSSLGNAGLPWTLLSQCRKGDGDDHCPHLQHFPSSP